MKTLKLLLLTAVLGSTLLAAGLAAGQARPPEQQPQRPTDQITLDVNVVNIVFTVSDKKGKLITNLKKEDFRVFEDDKPQQVSSFSAETDLPLTIALLVDTSGSIRDKLKFEQEAAIEFFYSTLMRGRDKATIITFDSGVDDLLRAFTEKDFTDDPELLANTINKIRAGGGTSLYDAVYLAVNEKLAKQQPRRVIILISDGDDNSSRVSMTEALETAQRFEAAIYGISTNATAYFGSRDQDRGDKTLKRFAEETGGRAFFPFQLKDLAASFQDIHEELRAQYSIAYTPVNYKADGAFHKLRVEVANNRQYKDLKVRHRSGYYATKVATSQR